MRFFFVISILLVILIGIGTLYLTLDTRRLVESPSEPPETETTKQLPTGVSSVESLPQRPPVTRTDTPNSATEKNSYPAWLNTAAQGIDAPAQGIDAPAQADNPWIQDTGRNGSEKLQTHPGGEFFDPRDPEMNEVVRQQLIRQFGDIPEVHIYVDGRLKSMKGVETTLAEQIEHAEATNKLFPNATTQKTLDLLYAIRSDDFGQTLKFVETSEPEPEDQPFADAIPFFEGKSPEEGFRALRAVNPDRAAALEAFLLRESEKDPSMLQNVKRAIALSYEPLQENK